DHFKDVNDTLGHAIGDSFLNEIAERLEGVVWPEDIVARHGGDEFVIVLNGANAPRARAVAEVLLEKLSEPVLVDGVSLPASASIGITLCPDDGRDAATLMRNADTAMYHAKERGRGNFQFFTQALNRAAQWRLTLGNALRNAIAHHELVVYYQPQVNMADGRIFSAEALLRWHRPGKEAISCNEFITVAEETGLILPIGEWVLREACRQLKEWHELGFDELTIAVNLSPRQFFQPDFLGMVRDVLHQSRLSAGSLDLEITEGMLMQRTEDNVATLKQLSGMGVKLSVDDFGTGYSSLAYLQRFPVDALKIDRSFISGIDQDRNHTALVGAIISMAHSLHLNVLAEGVETPEQIRFLQSHGCRSAQGFYYSEPVPAGEFTTLLRKQQRQHV
ncbi:MAG TPA: EAL domain-containing protein, partial [Noviherbaspirillum sp.]